MSSQTVAEVLPTSVKPDAPCSRQMWYSVAVATGSQLRLIRSANAPSDAARPCGAPGGSIAPPSTAGDGGPGVPLNTAITWNHLCTPAVPARASEVEAVEPAGVNGPVCRSA